MSKKYEYYEAVIRKTEQILEFRSLEQFVKFALANHISQIIITEDYENKAPSFALASKGALYICPTSGFKTIEDYQSASENNSSL